MGTRELPAYQFFNFALSSPAKNVDVSKHGINNSVVLRAIKPFSIKTAIGKSYNYTPLHIRVPLAKLLARRVSFFNKQYILNRRPRNDYDEIAGNEYAENI